MFALRKAASCVRNPDYPQEPCTVHC